MTTLKNNERKQTNITVRFPVDLVNALKNAAPERGFSGYQPLLRYYAHEGLRRDQERLHHYKFRRFIELLRNQGIPEEMLSDAARTAYMDCPPIMPDAGREKGSEHEEQIEARQPAELPRHHKENRVKSDLTATSAKPRCRPRGPGRTAPHKQKAVCQVVSKPKP